MARSDYDRTNRWYPRCGPKTHALPPWRDRKLIHAPGETKYTISHIFVVVVVSSSGSGSSVAVGVVVVVVVVVVVAVAAIVGMAVVVIVVRRQ